MNWYSSYKKEWKEIIETISNEIKRDSIMIEKDTIQSMILYELAKYDFPFVFKGGTSLSKAYNLIDRFSEDIDLSLSIIPTDKEKKKSKEIILEVANKLGLILTNPESIKSRYDYNKYVFKYESVFTDFKLEIIIETSYYQESYPTINHKIDSFIGKFCDENNIKLPIPFEAINFNMNVQSLERTFVDKVFAVCDYRLENMWERDSRHLYDIAKIYSHVDFNDIRILIAKVRNDRMKSKNNPSAQSQYVINDLLKEIINKKFFERDYNNLTNKLLYEQYPYDMAIMNGISKVIDLNIF